MAVTKITYGTSTAITCTTASLASSTTVGRQSTVIDNTSNLFDDVLVMVQVKTHASTAPANTKSCYVYVFGSEDGTNYDSDDAQPGATDAAYTLNAASNLKGPVVISTPTANKTYTKTFNVAAMFGGVMPRKWGVVITNDTNATLHADETTKSYTGITYTTA